MRASIAQVAKHANVSAMTVSRVIRGRKHQVNPETYERVLAAVRELNYVPMQSSFQNRHVETSTIGYVPHNTDVKHNQIDSVTLEGLCKEARQHGYDMLIMLRDETDWMANRQIVRFLDRRCDGFIILSPRCGEWQDVFELLIEQNVPVVICYRRDVPEGMAWVDPDNEEVMRLSVQHLVKHGHSRLALMVSPSMSAKPEGIEILEQPGSQDHFDDVERERYFSLFVREFGGPNCQGEIIRALDKQWQMFPNTIEFLLERNITGLICGDQTAMQLWDMAEKAGLKVPEDFSIVGVDNLHPAAHRGLTSVAFGYDAVGRLAVEAWVEMQRGKAARECCKVVPVRLMERQSVTKPRKP